MAENGRSLWRAVRPPAAPRGTRTCTARCRGNANSPAPLCTHLPHRGTQTACSHLHTSQLPPPL